MKPTLKPGLKRSLSFKVPKNKTVPHLYPEAVSFQTMPEVFATGFMVGLFEWACTELDRKSTRLHSSHTVISYAVFCLKKKNTHHRHSQARRNPHRRRNAPGLRHLATASPPA